jgi:ubiquinone/menaquinone biosynthesis C-methylase UbiE
MPPNYDWNEFWGDFSATAYDYTHFLPENKKMLEKVSSLVGENKTVLDVGCGSGNLLLYLLEKNDVTGIDYNEAMLTIARQKTRHNDNVQLFSGSAENLIFEDSAFDCITSVNVIYNLENPDQMIRECHRVLKPGGQIIISSPLKGLVMSEKFVKDVEKDRHLSTLNNDQYSALLKYNKILFTQGGFKFLPSLTEMCEMLTKCGFEILAADKVYYAVNFLIHAKKL